MILANLGRPYWFSPFRSTRTVTHVVVQVRFPNLPISRYHPTILEALGNLVGSLVKIDDATSQAQRGRFARLAVELDLSAPLRSSVALDGETLLVEYEGLPSVCAGCGFTGHDLGAFITTPYASNTRPESSGRPPGPSLHLPGENNPGSKSSVVPLALLSHAQVAEGRPKHAPRRRSLRPLRLTQVVTVDRLITGQANKARPHVWEAPVSTFWRTGSRVAPTGVVPTEPNGLPFGPILIEALMGMVQPEPNGNPPGLILTEAPHSPSGPPPSEGPSTVHTPPDPVPWAVGGPSGPASVDRGTGRGLGPLTPVHIRLQPSAPDNHLAIELRSHQRMVLRPGLLVGRLGARGLSLVEGLRPRRGLSGVSFPPHPPP
ncbi:hypothetical protein K2173_017568 [Erythroxylum novogranatense]|uniref:Uncharacterized protein n=1 Tax=Erythroxylum novogranatense TaxID=1862640 RepID=A0AAV8T949_9ROSI|nr:hypothetical protein K2173_017568 [Erythroxylum novogranatense]